MENVFGWAKQPLQNSLSVRPSKYFPSGPVVWLLKVCNARTSAPRSDSRSGCLALKQRRCKLIYIYWSQRMERRNGKWFWWMAFNLYNNPLPPPYPLILYRRKQRHIANFALLALTWKKVAITTFHNSADCNASLFKSFPSTCPFLYILSS